MVARVCHLLDLPVHRILDKPGIGLYHHLFPPLIPKQGTFLLSLIYHVDPDLRRTKHAGDALRGDPHQLSHGFRPGQKHTQLNHLPEVVRQK